MTLKNPHILIFSTEYKYIHVKIASLANVKSCVTVRMTVSVDYLSGLALLLKIYNSALQVSCHSQQVTVVSSAPKASWVVVMYTMNNHTHNAMRVRQLS